MWWTFDLLYPSQYPRLAVPTRNAHSIYLWAMRTVGTLHFLRCYLVFVEIGRNGRNSVRRAIITSPSFIRHERPNVCCNIQLPYQFESVDKYFHCKAFNISSFVAGKREFECCSIAFKWQVVLTLINVSSF